MSMRTYKVVNGRQEAELVRADRVDLNTDKREVTFYEGDDPIASFVGYTSFSPLEAVPEA